MGITREDKEKRNGLDDERLSPILTRQYRLVLTYDKHLEPAGLLRLVWGL